MGAREPERLGFRDDANAVDLLPIFVFEIHYEHPAAGMINYGFALKRTIRLAESLPVGLMRYDALHEIHSTRGHTGRWGDAPGRRRTRGCESGETHGRP